MRYKRLIVTFLVMAFALSGCASVVSKNLYQVTINSNPDEATILVTDEHGNKIYSGKTPAILALTSGESYFHGKKYHVTFSKPGYEEQTMEIRATLSGWYWGNILIGGLIGMLIVDPVTGNMFKLPSGITANLAEHVALKSAGSALQIVSLDQVQENLRGKLIRIN